MDKKWNDQATHKAILHLMHFVSKVFSGSLFNFITFFIYHMKSELNTLSFFEFLFTILFY